MSTSSSETELYAVADFCLLPLGLDTPSVGPQIALCQKVLEKSGLEYHMHGYGTNLEGSWSAVCKAIGDCHIALHKDGVARIATDIRIGTRTDKSITSGGNAGKVARVEKILAAEKEKAGVTKA